MGKPSHKRVRAENEAEAITRNLRISAQKLNLVARSIRGLPVERALNELSFSKKRVAKDVRKTLESAIANAENNHNLDVDSLVIAEAWTGKGLVMKRWRARARGRIGSILKPFSQLTIVVREAALSLPDMEEKADTAKPDTSKTDKADKAEKGGEDGTKS